MNPKIIKKYVGEVGNLEDIDFEYDREGSRPAWLQIKEPQFKAGLILVKTEKEPEVIYKRFAGNFYHPLEFRFKPLEEERFYLKFAQIYDQHLGRRNSAVADFILKKMFKYDIAKNAGVLDLGAGTGLFSELAAKAGYANLTLLDKSEAMLAVAKKKNHLSGAKFIVADAGDFKAETPFQAVVSVMMFDAVDDRQLPGILENVRKQLANGGYIFIVEDRARLAYRQFFKEKESGILKLPGKGNFRKYYFIGLNAARLT